MSGPGRFGHRIPGVHAPYLLTRVSSGTGSDYERGYSAGFDAARRYAAPDPRGGAR